MSLLHNMSQPPRTEVVIAPHRAGRPQGFVLRLSPADRRAALAQLRTEVGGSTDPLKLAAWTAERLQALGCPEVGVVRREPRSAHEDVDPVLGLAVLSRCFGNLFLLRRQPRWVFRGRIENSGFTIYDPTLASLLRRQKWS
jgi:hypothetical protein